MLPYLVTDINRENQKRLQTGNALYNGKESFAKKAGHDALRAFRSGTDAGITQYTIRRNK